MARKIFVSYKHKDSGVRPLFCGIAITTSRDYVNLLEQYFKDDHIFKGEREVEDLGGFKDETIESHLRDKIFDSSITIVLISKNMKEHGVNEEDQWIPWEISYSLKEINRENRKSATNAMLAVVLPDENNSYQYFVEHNCCTCCNSITWKIHTLFDILKRNMFNRKESKQSRCTNALCDMIFHTGNDHSYVYLVKWDDFISNVNWYIDLAVNINENIADYELKKAI